MISSIGWVQDLSLVSSILGLLVSLIGFAFTYARATRAANAADKALEVVQERNSIGDLSDAYARLQQIREFVRRGNIGAASAVFDNVYRNMAYIISVLNVRDDVSLEEIEKARRYLDRVKEGLEKLNDTDGQNAKHISQQLRIVEKFVVDNEAKLRMSTPGRA
jgi:hypothetical protein